MENLLFKEIVKLALILVSPLVILALLIFNEQPGIALGFLFGALLGVFRLKEFWGYITNALNHEKRNKDELSLIKYIASLLFTLGALGFIFVKSITIGLAILLGLVSVPIVVTVYAAMKGIALYREK